MSEDRCDILHNVPALHALKRHQLQSLTKKYGLKSNGKKWFNVSKITMSPSRTIYSPGPSATPGPNDFFSDTDTNTNTNTTPGLPSPRSNAGICQPGPVYETASGYGSGYRRAAKTSTGSEAWEMLSDSGASLVSTCRDGKSDSMRSWKSARNGQKLDEFGGPTGEMVQSGSMSSIKSLASSLKRSASQHLMSRSRRNSINMLADPIPQILSEPRHEFEHDVIEEMADSLPPSPASTVGVPRRYSGLSLLERPSTVRLVASPPPPEPESGDEDDDLPFVGTKSIQLLKERRSMAPLRSMDTLAATSMSRKSMPAISGTTSASFSNIYPPLPLIPAQFQKSRVQEPELSMPGALPISPLKQVQPPAFIFGSPQNAVSNTQFSEAGRAILAQMNAKMPEGLGFNEELLKGKQAGIDKLVKTSNLGEGGWGLGGSGPKDRYAEAHQREFSKMRSISKQNLGVSTSSRIVSSSSSRALASSRSTRDLGSSTSTSIFRAKGPNVDLGSSGSASTQRLHKMSSITLEAGSTPGKRKRSSVNLPSAPNGAALPVQPSATEVEAEVRAPEPKKRRTSVMGSLAEAGRSLLSLEVSPKKPKRRSSILPGGFKSKFGWLSRKKKTAPSAIPRSRTPVIPRKTSVYAPREPAAVKPKFDLNASLSQSTNTKSTRDATDYMSTTIAQKQRQASSSAQTVLSVSTTRSRPRIPDFGPAPSAASSVNTLGLPKPTSSSLASSMRKQSQADILKKVRAVPPPPAVSSEGSTRSKPTTSVSSSRLYAPTASSLARMQATVKPTGSRPMPTIPRTTSTSSTAIPAVPAIPAGPFANASSRDNVQFQSNFNVSKPLKPPAPASPMKKGKLAQSQMKSPLKAASSSRLRAQASGLHAVKSKPDLRKEREIAGRKAEIKARQGRLGEERELRKMLGDDVEM